MSEAIHVDRQLDAKGMLCPMPVISVKRAIKDLQRGQVLAVSATDKGACRDVPAWAEQTGHTLLEQTEENGVYTFYIEKAGWEDEEGGKGVFSPTAPARYRLRIIYCWWGAGLVRHHSARGYCHAACGRPHARGAAEQY